MHVIAQFEAVYISITPCLRLCISTTDYPMHTAFSPSRAEFCPLCHISKSRWLVKKICRTLWKSKFLSNHIRRHSDLISIARYDVRTLAFAWLCVQLACRVMNYSWDVRCACWAKIDTHRSTLVEYRLETLPYIVDTRAILWKRVIIFEIFEEYYSFVAKRGSWLISSLH